MPKRMAPKAFANIISSSGIGDKRILSRVLLFFSKVMVTESMEVVPKSMDKLITPGRMDKRSVTVVPVLMKNMPVHAKGKIIPQLILGGFK